MERLLKIGGLGILLLCLFGGVAMAAIITCTTGATTCTGTDNTDTITGTKGHDDIRAKKGGDTVYSQPYPFAYDAVYAKDLINGGPGEDVIRANDGDSFSSQSGDTIDCGKVSGSTDDNKIDRVYLDAGDGVTNSCRDGDLFFVSYAPQCDDSLDNDHDGGADLEGDTGCTSWQDDSETPGFVAPHIIQCQDGDDNDGDGLIDMADPNCVNTTDDNEAS